MLKAQETILTRICCTGISTQFFQLPLCGWVRICCLLSMAFHSTLPTAAHSGEAAEEKQHLRRRSGFSDLPCRQGISCSLCRGAGGKCQCWGWHKGCWQIPVVLRNSRISLLSKHSSPE